MRTAEGNTTQQRERDEVTERVLRDAPGPTPSKPSPKKAPPKKAAPKKPAAKKQPARKRDEEASALAKQAKLISEGLGKTSPFGSGEGRLFLDGYEVVKAKGGAITVTRKADKAAEKFKAGALKGDLDKDTKAQLTAITVDKRVHYPSKLRCFILAAAGSAS